MTDSARSFVSEAELDLSDGTDPAAVGAAVTTALCGHWEHDGPCRWPHNNQIQPVGEGFGFRTLFIADADEEVEVRERIEAALRGQGEWVVRRATSRIPLRSETPLAERLAALPRRRGGS